MIEFALADAHPDYQRLIRIILSALTEQYPIADLRAVRLYRGRPGDRSMGNSTTPHEIHLNAMWFTQPPDVLKAAGEIVDYVPREAVGGTELRWHGSLAQPYHILIHEVFHKICDGIGREAIEFAHSLWSEATIKPSLAPTGYALTDPSEFFAEAGCMCEAGNPYGNQLVEEFGLFIRDYETS